MRLSALVLLICPFVAGCGGGPSGASAGGDGRPGASDGADPTPDGKSDAAADGASDSGASDGDASDGGASDSGANDSGASDSGATASCTTLISYGDAWLHPAQHPAATDVASGAVTWDGICHDDGSNAYALLSNGWKPYFSGHGSCVLALDQASGCAGAPTACSTRATYGASWLHPDGHTAQFDQVAGRLTWDRACHASGSQSYASFSNGWAPHFDGSDGCAVSLSYTQCGGLYQNSVLPEGCADPGVLRDGDRWLAACTSGNAANAFPIYVSTDLVHWSATGSIFPSARKPTWAQSDFWAPEIHKVGAGYVAYFTARHSDGKLSIGAATAPSVLGPFTDIGQPLVHDAAMGLIDATEFEAADGSRYLYWKEDGNAVGKPTPIHGQRLAADGVSLTGTPSTAITNDRGWEGAVVEGPWVTAHDGSYYLFYSGNSYANATYAVGVARATSPLGPFTKADAPILTTGGPWVGPGHCSVVDGPGGDSYMVYHAWQSGHVNTAGSPRVMLVDRIVWQGGWPALPGGPSSTSMPMP